MKPTCRETGTGVGPARREPRALPLLFRIVVAACCAVAGNLALAHGALANRDTCILTIGPYSMYFSGYIPEKMGSEKFCDDLPTTGHAFIVMDFIQRKLRNLPVEMEIVRNVDIEGKPENDGEVVFHKPARVYPNGTIEWDHDFTEQAYYVGVVRVTDSSGKVLVARFPFGVGNVGTTPTWLPWLGLGAFIVLVFGVVLYWYRKEPRSEAPREQVLRKAA